jgi:hypothetical protein
VSLELRHQIETRQCNVKRLAQVLTNFVFNSRGTRKQAQPQTQRGMLIGMRSEFMIGIDREAGN